ncbi:hypothetical protein F4553_002270 [Allocatelliglobosispora scoriae]|uniref:Uncharacterized protein n=1 Tax=Allocatelliglobosispora scoriae TaxID=643052 RepID=A0A841BPY1_9ACTN|nr:hypothetical protein [Allocatelliglobosispora scoriae]MBB5868891.1 hypothetical protein [Allocatelliglobosispora scoriae]
MLPAYLLAFGLTLAVEIPLYAIALSLGWRVPWRRAVLFALVVNVCTHPALWFALAAMRERSAYPMLVLICELLVCAAEGLLLTALLRRRDPLLVVLSIAVNGASVLAGLMVSWNA